MTSPIPTVAAHVGDVLTRLGVDHVFGVLGSGNFHVTNALVTGGARFIQAAHEAGATTMADAYARVSGRVGVVSVHQGSGLTNALTGIAEAAKSRTPLIVLAPEATSPRSDSFIDPRGMAFAVGADFHRVRVETATEDVMTAWRLATFGLGGTVVLALPLEVQTAEAVVSDIDTIEVSIATDPDPTDIAILADLLRTAERSVFIAGRGAARQPWAASRTALLRLADRCGALLATTAAAKGFFAGTPWNLDVIGGFASPRAAAMMAESDLIVAWGATLNMWTTRHGKLISPSATVVRVDHDADALPEPFAGTAARDVGVRGDVRHVADAVFEALAGGTDPDCGVRTLARQRQIATEVGWRDVSYVDDPSTDRIDPRTLSIALDDLLPAERTVAVDSGNFMGYPSMFLSVPDASGFCLTQAYPSVGLGLSAAIGAALARPDRLTVAALGDGGFLMSVAELTTVVRLGLPLVIVVYDDAAFGAEARHVGPLDIARFSEPPIAAIAKGFGCAGVTIRSLADFGPVTTWLAGRRKKALVIDAKIRSGRGSWWLEAVPGQRGTGPSKRPFPVS